jgi:hypothetical protein
MLTGTGAASRCLRKKTKSDIDVVQTAMSQIEVLFAYFIFESK